MLERRAAVVLAPADVDVAGARAQVSHALADTHCPGGAAGHEQYEAAEHGREEEEKGCEQDEPPPAAEQPYPDTSDGRYRGRPRHGSWDFEHTRLRAGDRQDRAPARRPPVRAAHGRASAADIGPERQVRLDTAGPGAPHGVRAAPPARGVAAVPVRQGSVYPRCEGDLPMSFPNLGSQRPGRAVPRPGLTDARDARGRARRCPDLLERCLDLVGEDPFLRVEESTRFQQPAIFCASWAGWTALRDEPCAAAGHSLGELAALAAAGVLRSTTRSSSSCCAAADGRGRPARLDDRPGRRRRAEDAAAIAEAAGVIVANDNAPGQIVLAGDRASARERRGTSPASAACARSRCRSPARSTRPSMEPAVAPFRAALDEVEVAEPRFPVISCASAQPFDDVRAELAAALDRTPCAGARRSPRCTRPARGASSRSARARCSRASASGSSPARRSRPSSWRSRMRSATLPPDLRRRARGAPQRARGRAAAHRDDPRPRPPPAARGRAERPDRRAHRRRRRLDRQAHRHPLAPPRGADDERLADLATFAARKALADAGVEPLDVDLVLVATMSQDELTPNTAPLVAHALGAERAGAIDVGAACTGWLSGLQLAAGQIESGRAERVLLIGAEILTRLTDFDDRKTAALFGDGAGAVVLGPRRRRRRSGRSRCAADGALARDDLRHARGPQDPHGRPRHVPERGQAPVRGHASRRSRRRASSSTTSTCSSTTRPTGASCARSASASTCRRPRSPTTSASSATRRPRRSRSRSACCARTAACGPATACCVAAIGAGFTWGAGVVEWGIA